MAMKRPMQRRFYRETKDLTPAELIAYIRRRIEGGAFSEFCHDTPQALPVALGRAGGQRADD
jgi:hypothetical protein